MWALALSADGKFLAGTTVDGKILVWQLSEPAEGNAGPKGVVKKILVTVGELVDAERPLIEVEAKA